MMRLDLNRLETLHCGPDNIFSLIGDIDVVESDVETS